MSINVPHTIHITKNSNSIKKNLFINNYIIYNASVDASPTGSSSGISVVPSLKYGLEFNLNVLLEVK